MGAPRFATALFLLGLCFSGPSAAYATANLPSVLLQSAEGQSVFLKSLLAPRSGNVLVLSFGAAWCAPCLKEAPVLARLIAKNTGFDLVFVSEDAEGVLPLSSFLRRRRAKAPVYADPDRNAMQTLNILGLPTTLFFAPDGRELWRVEGMVDWKEQKNMQKLEQLKRAVGKKG